MVRRNLHILLLKQNKGGMTDDETGLYGDELRP